jgi:cytoskeletal protein CcmA (bactofilin family)
MKKYILPAIVATAFVASAAGVSAATFINEDSTKLDQAISDDLFIAGQSVTVDHAVAQDVYAAGRTVRITEHIGQDVHAAGQAVEITGNVGDDVIAAGSSILLAGNVAGDALLAGSNVTIKSGATIGGDVLTFGGTQLTVEPGATIKGKTRVIAPMERPAAEKRSDTLTTLVRYILGLFVSAWLLAFALPIFTVNATVAARQRPGRSFVTGFVWLLLFVPAAIIAFVTTVGTWIGLTILFSTIAFVMLSSLVATILLGSWAGQAISAQLDKAAGKSVPVRVAWPHILLGAVIYAVLSLLGPIGWLISAVLVAISLGGILRSLWSAWHPSTQA